MKKIVLIVLVVLAILMLPLLGGSMIWMLGGADGLDINATAQTINRPAESISVGDDWEYYGGDYDLESQPELYSIWKNGRSLDVVAQATKTGLVFVLNRASDAILPMVELDVAGCSLQRKGSNCTATCCLLASSNLILTRSPA